MSSPENREIQPRDQTREPQVIGPQQNPLINVFQALGEGIRQAVQGSFYGGVDYADLPAEDKKIVDEMMETLKPEIEKKAVALITAELKDRIARKGNVGSVAKLLNKGKQVSLKRHRGCIYLQFGTGEPDDEIEEFLVMTS